MTSSFDQRDGYIWMDGETIPWRDAKLHVLSHALHYASAVFEGVRSYNGHIFKLSEHIERLFFSAETLQMKVPYSPQQLEAACKEILKTQKLDDGYLRPIIWRGSEMLGVSAQKNKIHVAIAAWEWPSYFDPEQKMKGVRLSMAQYRRPSPETAPCHGKAAGLYMICTIEKHRAEAEGYADALMLDYRGYIAETTGANVFFIDEKGVIHTPIPDCFLDGITRRAVIELARAAGIVVTERVIMPDEMGKFEQCFITGTAAEVTPVSEIGEHRFQIGDITKKLMEKYSALVRSF
ncbi:MAG: branched-chain amino acid aminotransferase [Parvibaculales bacterium]